MTERLYYSDSHLAAFSAKVMSCEPAGEGYAVVLDRTAFFSEGGGQKADTGMIGDVFVHDVQEKNGEIFHYTKRPLATGEYNCRIDWNIRYARMQSHSGEHIVSGLVHSRYGYDNVGFHMGEQCMTLDFNGELTQPQLVELEALANRAVSDDLEITATFPSEKELSQLAYRSKKELEGQVRIVTIEGIDCCACCAPHTSRTGEIGLVKILGSMRHRGGTRVEVVCGADALAVFNSEHENACAISAALSVPREQISAAVERLQGENEKLKYRSVAIERCLVAAMLDGIIEADGNICLFAEELSESAARELVNGAVPKCGGFAAVFYGAKGEYKYIIGSRNVDLRTISKALNQGIDGRGGGKSEMLQGSARADAQNIKEFINRLQV